MNRLRGKCAIILGAAVRGNIGQGIARRFAAEGATVLVAGRHQSELEDLAGELGGIAHSCDITHRDDVFALAEAAKDQLGRIDIAVNATGEGLLKPFELTSESELRQITELQFIGPFQFFQAVLGVMQGPGSLIQISSATAMLMLEDHAAYMGTKAAFDHVIRCLANEYGARGIRANSISPGLTETPLTTAAKAIPGIFAVFRACYPLGRIGTVADIAAAATWLASDECFMTGQNLQVNGGLTLRRNPTREELDAVVFRATGKVQVRPWDEPTA